MNYHYKNNISKNYFFINNVLLGINNTTTHSTKQIRVEYIVFCV